MEARLKEKFILLEGGEEKKAKSQRFNYHWVRFVGMGVRQQDSSVTKKE